MAKKHLPDRLSAVSTKRTNWWLHPSPEEGVFPQPQWECWRLSQRRSLELTKPHDVHMLSMLLSLLHWIPYTSHCVNSFSLLKKKMYTMNWSSAHVGHFLHDLVCQWLQLCACSLQRYRSSVDSSGLVCLCTPKHGLMWSEHPSGRKHLEVSQESPSSGRKHRAWFHTQTVPYKKTKARVSKRIQTALTSAENRYLTLIPRK